MFPTTVGFSLVTLVATVVYPTPLKPATSQTDRAPAAYRSSDASRRGLVLGTLCHTARPTSASPHPPLVPRIHPAGSVLRAAGHRVPNPARLVAICTIAAGRSPARG